MPLQLNTIEEYDFVHGFHRNFVTGKYIAIQPHDLGRPLTHAEMDYNLILNEQTQAGFRIFGSNPDLTLSDDDLGSSLVFHKISADDDDFAKYQSKGYSVDQYIWILDCCAPKFDCDLFVVDSICSFIVESVTATPEDPCINFVVDSICGNFDIDSVSSENSGGTSPGAVFFNFATNVFGNDPFIFTPGTAFADVAYTIVGDGITAPTGPANFINNHVSGTMISINSTNDPNVYTGIYRFSQLIAPIQGISGYADVDALVGGYNITSRWYYSLQPAQGGGGKGQITPTPTSSEAAPTPSPSTTSSPTPTPTSSEVAPTPTPSSSEAGPGIVNFTVEWEIEDNSLNTLQVADGGQRYSPKFTEEHTYNHGNQNYMAMYTGIIPLPGYEFTGAANEISFTLNGTPIVSGGSDLSNNVAMFIAQWETSAADANQGAGRYALTLSITGQTQYGADGPIEEGQEFKIEATSLLTAPTPTPSPSESAIPPTPTPSPSESAIPPTPQHFNWVVSTDAAATNRINPVLEDQSTEPTCWGSNDQYWYYPLQAGETYYWHVEPTLTTSRIQLQMQAGVAAYSYRLATDNFQGLNGGTPCNNNAGVGNGFNVTQKWLEDVGGIYGPAGNEVVGASPYFVTDHNDTISNYYKFTVGANAEDTSEFAYSGMSGSYSWNGSGYDTEFPFDNDEFSPVGFLVNFRILAPTPTPTVSTTNTPTPTPSASAGPLTNTPSNNDRYTMSVIPAAVEESEAGNPPQYMQFAIQAINGYDPAPGTTVGYTITGDWSQGDIQVLGIELSDPNNISSPVPSAQPNTVLNPYTNIFKIGTEQGTGAKTAAIRVYAAADTIIENVEAVRVTLDEYDSTGNMTSGVGVWNTGNISDEL